MSTSENELEFPTLEGERTKTGVHAPSFDVREGVCLLDSSGLLYPLTEGCWLVGRSKAAQVRVDDEFVSRRHAELRLGALGLVVRDLGSRGGTWVNALKVDQALLKLGDEVRLGTSFTLRVLSSSEGQQQLQQLYARSTRDALTGLHSWAYFLEALQRDVDACLRHRTPLAVVACSLLPLQEGPPTPDQVPLLTQLAVRLDASTRNEDIVARREGTTQLVALLRECDEEYALRFAERVRMSLMSGFPALAEQGLELRMGVAGFERAGARTADEFIARVLANLARARSSADGAAVGSQEGR